MFVLAESISTNLTLVIRLGAGCDSRQTRLEGITERTGNQCFSQLREGINVPLQCCLVASNQMKGEPYLLSQDFRLCEHTHIYIWMSGYSYVYLLIFACVFVHWKAGWHEPIMKNSYYAQTKHAISTKTGNAKCNQHLITAELETFPYPGHWVRAGAAVAFPAWALSFSPPPPPTAA